jgi:hypothetical protein
LYIIFDTPALGRLWWSCIWFEGNMLLFSVSIELIMLIEIIIIMILEVGAEGSIVG